MRVIASATIAYRPLVYTYGLFENSIYFEYLLPIEFIIISNKYLLNRNESNRYRTIAYGITWNIHIIYCEFNMKYIDTCDWSVDKK